MDRLYVYHGAWTVFGVAIGADGLISVATEGVDWPAALVLLGGGSMVVTSVYEMLTTDPAEFSIEAVAVFAAILAALFAFLGTVLQVLL